MVAVPSGCSSSGCQFHSNMPSAPWRCIAASTPPRQTVAQIAPVLTAPRSPSQLLHPRSFKVARTLFFNSHHLAALQDLLNPREHEHFTLYAGPNSLSRRFAAPNAEAFIAAAQRNGSRDAAARMAASMALLVPTDFGTGISSCDTSESDSTASEVESSSRGSSRSGEAADIMAVVEPALLSKDAAGAVTGAALKVTACGGSSAFIGVTPQQFTSRMMVGIYMKMFGRAPMPEV